jgi:integrase
MWKVDGKRREMGLGSLHSVPLAHARELAEKARQDRAAGRDPIAARDAGTEKTFAEAATELVESMSVGWRNEKHKAQWVTTLRDYCLPVREKPVSAIGTDDVLEILKPIWQTKAETASRLRGRIERVLDMAKARGWRTGENPARWRGHLDAILPKRAKLSRGHHSAMAFKAVPAFVTLIREMEGVSARVLEFTILTAARSGEALNAEWSEIDLDAKLWTLPGHRMKGGREHRVPLSDRAAEIVAEMAKARVSKFVFPGMRRARPLSNMALEMLLRRMNIKTATVHGFRSAFRDWAGETTTFSREVAEAALAHLVGDETERAYRRGDAIEKRRKLMDAWAAFIEKSNNVVVLNNVRG